MASISGICYSSSTFIREKLSPSSNPHRKHHLLSIRPRPPHLLRPIHSIARETPADVKHSQSLSAEKKGLEKDPFALWERYVDWLYQHKDLGLFLDVSRIGFTDDFVREMEPRLQKAFRAMQELEKGADREPRRGKEGRALLVEEPSHGAQLVSALAD